MVLVLQEELQLHQQDEIYYRALYTSMSRLILHSGVDITLLSEEYYNPSSRP